MLRSQMRNDGCSPPSRDRTSQAMWENTENLRVRDAELEEDKEALDIVERGDTVILVALLYQLEGTESLINLVYPLSVFEPILDKLDALPGE